MGKRTTKRQPSRQRQQRQQRTSAAGELEDIDLLPREWQYDANLSASKDDFKQLLERFSNNHSLDALINAITRLVTTCTHDYALRDFFEDVKGFVDRCLDNVSYMQSNEYYERGGNEYC